MGLCRTSRHVGSLPPLDPADFYNSSRSNGGVREASGRGHFDGSLRIEPLPDQAALQSASGCYPWTSASACKVKAIVQLETGCFGNLTGPEITTLSHIPILIMYGDYANGDPTASCQTEISQITNAGGDIKFAWLPHLVPNDLYPGSPGPIYGNEHMMMLDNNNQQIAQIIIDWRLHAVCSYTTD